MAGKGRELAGIGAGQWGLVTAAQARESGVTAQNMAQMAKAGDLVRLAHGVYRLAGTPIDRHEDLRAAWLALDPSRTAGERIADDDVAMVSHRSAALVLELGDLDADIMEFTLPRRRQTRRTDVRLHRGATRGDWTLVEGLPVATPRRTIADLAGAGVDRGHLATIVWDAMIKYGLVADDAASVLAAYARRYGGVTGDGRGLLTTLVGEAGVPRSTADVAARGAASALAELLRTQWTADDPALLRAVSAFQRAVDDPAFLRALSAFQSVADNPELLRALNAFQSVADNPQFLQAISAVQNAIDPDALREIMFKAAPAPTPTQCSSAQPANRPPRAIESRNTKHAQDSGDGKRGARSRNTLDEEQRQRNEVDDNDVGRGEGG